MVPTLRRTTHDSRFLSRPKENAGWMMTCCHRPNLGSSNKFVQLPEIFSDLLGCFGCIFTMSNSGDGLLPKMDRVVVLYWHLFRIEVEIIGKSQILLLTNDVIRNLPSTKCQKWKVSCFCVSSACTLLGVTIYSLASTRILAIHKQVQLPVVVFQIRTQYTKNESSSSMYTDHLLQW